MISWIMHARIALLFWWFMTLTPNVPAGPTNIIATQGPFSNIEQCEWARNFAISTKTSTSPCWSDGR